MQFFSEALAEGVITFGHLCTDDRFACTISMTGDKFHISEINPASHDQIWIGNHSIEASNAKIVDWMQAKNLHF